MADDWRRDSRRAPSISFEKFKDALFELADTWVESVDPNACATFLNRLLRSVTRSPSAEQSGPPGSPGRLALGARDAALPTGSSPPVFLEDDEIMRAGARCVRAHSLGSLPLT